MQHNQTSQPFRLVSNYSPAGDQAKVISEVTESLEKDKAEQTILGVTGSGKTYIMASIVEKLQRPTIVIAHNKTLAAQLAEEFARFFPDNAVHYFVSYYDYYQPESYVPSSDTYIEKQTEINENIERLRNAATQALLTRKDVLIVASVSCIYGVGSPEDFTELAIEMTVGEDYKMDKLARRMTDLQYTRVENTDLKRGYFSISGQVLDMIPSGDEHVYRFTFWGDTLEEISVLEYVTKKVVGKIDSFKIFPATQYVTTETKINEAKLQIVADMEKRSQWFLDNEKYIEAQRIRERVNNDVEMLETVGYVGGIENYSRYLDKRRPGDAPSTLLDYFPDDALMFIDESHITLPQIGAMFYGDYSRKKSLVDYGFRLDSAFDNRPLKYNEFFSIFKQKIYVSATPGKFEQGLGAKPLKDDEVKKLFLAEIEILKEEVLDLL
jgi:excinuclease ABC subunit B